MPPLNQDFKVRMSKDLGIKKEVLGLRIETNECPLDFLSNLFATQYAYQKLLGKNGNKLDIRF